MLLGIVIDTSGRHSQENKVISRNKFVIDAGVMIGVTKPYLKIFYINFQKAVSNLLQVKRNSKIQ